MSENIPKTGRAKTVVLVIIILILAVLAGVGGAILTNFSIFPAIAKIPYFEQFLEADENGQTIFKLVEREKEIVTEDTAFWDVVDLNKRAIVTVVSERSGNTIAPGMVGTGFIVSADGLIVTNKHLVLDDASVVKVIRDDYSVDQAEVVARDPLNDLALLKIDVDNLSVANLYPADEISLGQRVLSLGHKYEKRENFVSFGVLGAVNRGVLNTDEVQLSRMEGLLQTDALVASANTGGPLTNLSGEVIGLLASIGEPGFEGYAIPISLVRSAIDSYINHDRICRSSLGVNWQTVTPDMAQIESLDRWEGALLVANENAPAVTPGGPAAQIGLKAGDIIHKIDDRSIDLDNGFMRMLQEYEPGAEIEISYIRDNEAKTAKVKVGESR